MATITPEQERATPTPTIRELASTWTHGMSPEARQELTSVLQNGASSEEWQATCERVFNTNYSPERAQKLREAFYTPSVQNFFHQSQTEVPEIQEHSASSTHASGHHGGEAAEGTIKLAEIIKHKQEAITIPVPIDEHLKTDDNYQKIHQQLEQKTTVKAERDLERRGIDKNSADGRAYIKRKLATLDMKSQKYFEKKHKKTALEYKRRVLGKIYPSADDPNPESDPLYKKYMEEADKKADKRVKQQKRRIAKGKISEEEIRKEERLRFKTHFARMYGNKSSVYKEYDPELKEIHNKWEYAHQRNNKIVAIPISSYLSTDENYAKIKKQIEEKTTQKARLYLAKHGIDPDSAEGKAFIAKKLTSIDTHAQKHFEKKYKKTALKYKTQEIGKIYASAASDPLYQQYMQEADKAATKKIKKQKRNIQKGKITEDEIRAQERKRLQTHFAQNFTTKFTAYRQSDPGLQAFHKEMEQKKVKQPKKMPLPGNKEKIKIQLPQFRFRGITSSRKPTTPSQPKKDKLQALLPEGQWIRIPSFMPGYEGGGWEGGSSGGGGGGMSLGGTAQNVINRIQQAAKLAKRIGELAEGGGLASGISSVVSFLIAAFGPPFIGEIVILVVVVLSLIIGVIASIFGYHYNQTVNGPPAQPVPGLTLSMLGPTHVNNPGPTATNITYTITAVYTGSDHIILTDQLPVETTYVSSDPNGTYNVSAGTTVWDLTKIPSKNDPNGGKDYTITLVLKPTYADTTTTNSVNAQPASQLQSVKGDSTISMRVVRASSADATQYYPDQRWNFAYTSSAAFAMSEVINAYGLTPHPLIAGDVLREGQQLGVYTSTQGLVTTAGFATVGGKYGFAVDSGNARSLGDIITLANDGIPVIVSLQGTYISNSKIIDFSLGQVVVVTGGDDNTVRIVDSSLNNIQLLTYQQFNNLWTGFSSVFTPQ